MRTVLLLTSLTNVCSSYKYIQLECHVNDGSEVVAQRVLDELSDAVMTRNRTAIADCLSDTFGFSGKVRSLKKDFVATMYSGFRDLRFFKVWMKSFEFVNGEDVEIDLHISEPLNHDMGILPRNPYTIYLYLKSVGGVYKANLVEYHTEYDWPGI